MVPLSNRRLAEAAKAAVPAAELARTANRAAVAVRVPIERKARRACPPAKEAAPRAVSSTADLVGPATEARAVAHQDPAAEPTPRGAPRL
jgi:hypothetical protein